MPLSASHGLATNCVLRGAGCKMARRMASMRFAPRRNPDLGDERPAAIAATGRGVGSRRVRPVFSAA
jgi:hypothetical protein